MHRYYPAAFLLLASAAVSLVACRDPSLGLGNRELDDDQLSASSIYATGNRACSSRNARLNGKDGAGSWCAQVNRAGEYLQVDLHGVARVTSVATQGRNPASRLYRGAKQWVTSYRVQYSADGVTWEYVRAGKDGKGAPVTFQGNKDSDTVKANDLPSPVECRYLRFVVQSWRSHISMRAEVYGKMIKRDQLGKPLGLANGRVTDSQITASSQWGETVCAPQAGRLDSKASAGAWCAKTNDKAQYLQVNLRGVVSLTGIATQAREVNSRSHRGAKQWVESYFIDTSMDGQTWEPVTAPDSRAPLLFRGNNDWTTTVRHALPTAVKAKFVRVRPQSWFGHVSMRLELYGKMMRPDALGRPLGMESGKILDGQITSSSTFRVDNGCDPTNARLNGKSGAGSWCAAANRPGEWLQVDFGGAVTVNGVATQGRSRSPKQHGTAAQWVTKYQLQYSPDGIDWMTYSRDDARVTFDGNQDRHTPVLHYLDPPVHARFVRVKVLGWHGHVSMRAEFYGTQHTKLVVGASLGVESGRIRDRQLTASSSWPGLPPAMARVNGRSAWAARTNDVRQWLQVDLGRVAEVGGIGTQGRHAGLQWVTKYRVSYSLDGKKWSEYMRGGSAYIFGGNSNWATEVRHAFLAPFLARFVRVHPVAWNSHISMRVELYRVDARRRRLLANLGAALNAGKSRAGPQIIAEGPTRGAAFGAQAAPLRSKAGGGAWCGRSAGPSERESLLIDLRSAIDVGGIATQGRATGGEWVTTYRVEHSLDRRAWSPYLEDNLPKEFRANLDGDSVMTHSFSRPFKARYVRIVPMGAVGHVCMRADVFNSARAELERKRLAAVALAKKKADEKAEAVRVAAAAKRRQAQLEASRVAEVAKARRAAQLLAEAETRERAEAAKVRADQAKRDTAAAQKERERLARDKAEAVRERDALARAHAAAKDDKRRAEAEKKAALAKAQELDKKVEALREQARDADFDEARLMNAIRKISALEEMIRQLRLKNQRAVRNLGHVTRVSTSKDKEVATLRSAVRIWQKKAEAAAKEAKEMRTHISKRDREEALAAAIAAKAAAKKQGADSSDSDSDSGSDSGSGSGKGKGKGKGKQAPKSASELIADDEFNGPDRFPKPDTHPGKENTRGVVPSVTREDYGKADDLARKTLAKADRKGDQEAKVKIAKAKKAGRA